MDLLETLATRMGCEYLGELRLLSRPNTKLRHIVANMPLTAFSDKEWLGAADYLCGVKCQCAKDAREAMMIF